MARQDLTQGLKESKNFKEHPITGDRRRDPMSRSNIQIDRKQEDHGEKTRRQVFSNTG